MKNCLLRIIAQLGNLGYYARTEMEREIINVLEADGLVKQKKGTKSVYQITENGKEFIERLYHGRDNEITKEEFLQHVKNAYYNLASPMKPAIKIPMLRKKVVSDAHISDHLFDQSLLYLHKEGELTLQTALTAKQAKGGIRDHEKHFFYVLMED